MKTKKKKRQMKNALHSFKSTAIVSVFIVFMRLRPFQTKITKSFGHLQTYKYHISKQQNPETRQLNNVTRKPSITYSKDTIISTLVPSNLISLTHT